MTAIEDGSNTGEVEEVDVDDEVGAWRSPESTSMKTRLARASARGGGPPARADAAGGTQRRSGGGGARRCGGSGTTLRGRAAAVD